MKQGQIIISTDGEKTPLHVASFEASETEVDAALEDAPEQRDTVVPADWHGQRLDRALALLVPEFSRSYLQQLIAADAVTLDGSVVTKAATKLRVGQRLGVTLRPTPQSQAFVPEAMDLHVVYEDAHLLVIDKPAGLVVHPAAGNWTGTLLNGLLARDETARQLPRAGIVHRLDKDTSGLMVVAKSRQAMDALVHQMAARKVKRQYLALAHRAWAGPSPRRVDAPIGRDPQMRLRMAVVDLAHQSGKTAVTHIEHLADAEQACLVRCTLETGRTHQIRVHMAYIGHPLIGDGLYGGAPRAGMARQALHAFELALQHPVTSEAMCWRATPPADWLALAHALGLAQDLPSDTM